jgi:hypothetical protein
VLADIVLGCILTLITGTFALVSLGVGLFPIVGGGRNPDATTKHFNSMFAAAECGSLRAEGIMKKSIGLLAVF